MKKYIVILITIRLICGMAIIATAESSLDFSVSTEKQQYDDVQIGQVLSIDTFGEVTITDCTFISEIGYYQAGSHTVGSSDDYYKSALHGKMWDSSQATGRAR